MGVIIGTSGGESGGYGGTNCGGHSSLGRPTSVYTKATMEVYGKKGIHGVL